MKSLFQFFPPNYILLIKAHRKIKLRTHVPAAAAAAAATPTFRDPLEKPTKPTPFIFITRRTSFTILLLAVFMKSRVPCGRPPLSPPTRQKFYLFSHFEKLSFFKGGNYFSFFFFFGSQRRGVIGGRETKRKKGVERARGAGCERPVLMN